MTNFLEANTKDLPMAIFLEANTKDLLINQIATHSATCQAEISPA